MFLTAFLFIGILALLVLVHEFGHFIAAKRSGMKVLEFGFGFPPRIFGVQKVDGKTRYIFGHPKDVSDNSTVYSFNLIPLGGFVKIFGENNDAANQEGSFTSKAFFPRLATLVAGILMNFLLAWTLFSIGYMVGLPAAVDSGNIPTYAKISDEHTTIIEVDNDSPALRAGLKPNDTVVSVDSKLVTTSTELQEYIKSNRGKEFSFGVKRGSENITLIVKSDAEPAPGKGSVGITMTTVGNLSYPPLQAIGAGAVTTLDQIKEIFKGLYGLVVRGIGLSSVGGPVKIAQITGEVADMGLIYLLQFTALLSINLGVLNSLPFPALDGGRVLFLLIEKVRGKKNNQLAEQYANTIGFALLLLLMLVVTVKDVSSLNFVHNAINSVFK